MSRLLLLLLFFASYILLAQSTPTCWYVSSSRGSDTNNGRSESLALASLGALNKLQTEKTIAAGDTIALKRGDTFLGTLLVTVQNLTVRNYGSSGDLPIISGGLKVTHWDSHIAGVHTAQLSSLLNSTFGFSTVPTDATPALWLDGKQQWIARSPNPGSWFRVNTAPSQLSFTVANATSIVAGSTFRLRTSHWTYDYRPIASYDAGSRLITYTTKVSYDVKQNMGFYVDGKAEYMDQDGEWVLESNGQLQLKYSSDPSSHEVVLAIAPYAIWSTARGTVLNGIAFAYTSLLAVRLDQTNASVSGCRIERHGGRGLTGPGWTSLTYNNISDVNGLGVIVSGSYSSIVHSFVTNIGLFPGYGCSGVNCAVGLQSTQGSYKALFQYNRIDHCGYIGIRFDGTYNLVDRNFITHVLETMDDGGAIYAWGKSFGSTVSNNVIDSVISDVQSCAPTDRWTNGIGLYLDDGSHDVSLLNNVVTNVRIGISAPNGTIIRGNTFYNFITGVVFGSSYAPGIVVQNNVFMANKKASEAHTLFITWLDKGNVLKKTFSGNYYCSPRETTPIFGLSVAQWISNYEHTATTCEISPWNVLGYDGVNIIDNGNFTRSTQRWVRYPEDGLTSITSLSSCPSGMPSPCVEFTMTGAPHSGLFYNSNMTKAQANRLYEVSFNHQAPSSTSYRVDLVSHHDDVYGEIPGTGQMLVADTTASFVRYIFSPTADDRQCRLNFGASTSASIPSITLHITNISLRLLQGSLVDMDGEAIMVYNPTDVSAMVALPSTTSYEDLSGTRHSCQMQLGSYAGAVLIKPKTLSTPCSGGSRVEVSGVGILVAVVLLLAQRIFQKRTHFILQPTRGIQLPGRSSSSGLGKG